MLVVTVFFLLLYENISLQFRTEEVSNGSEALFEGFFLITLLIFKGQ